MLIPSIPKCARNPSQFLDDEAGLGIIGKEEMRKICDAIPAETCLTALQQIMSARPFLTGPTLPYLFRTVSVGPALSEEPL
jgi:hypothetical protein